MLHTRLPPTVAALAMALSSLSVVASSLALHLYRPPKVTGTGTALCQSKINNSTGANADIESQAPLLGYHYTNGTCCSKESD